MSISIFSNFFLENVSLSVLTYFSQPVSLKYVTVSLCELPFAVTQLEKQLLSSFLPENTKDLSYCWNNKDCLRLKTNTM